MSSPIIGINTLFLIPNHVGGTEYYTRNIIQQMIRDTTDQQYIIFCNRENAQTFHISHPHWKKVIVPISAGNRIYRILYEQVIFPLIVRAHRCSELWSPGYFGPIFHLGWKHTVTIHDANWRDHPDDVSQLQRIVLSVLIEANIAAASKIITDSDFSKARLIAHFPKIRGKLQVKVPAIDPIFHPRVGRKRKSLLCVSAMYPHKRMPYLLELWGELARQLPEYELIVIGQNGADAARVQAQLDSLQRVKYYKKVPLQDLIRHYQTTALAIFPSVYEGFGYPVYEAHACGAQIIVGNKHLYQPSVRRDLYQLTFNVKKDVWKILKVLNVG